VTTAIHLFLGIEAILLACFIPVAVYALRNGRILFRYLRDRHQDRWSEIAGTTGTWGMGVGRGRLGDRGIRYVFSDLDGEKPELSNLKRQAKRGYLLLVAPFILTAINFAGFISYWIWSGCPEIP